MGKAARKWSGTAMIAAAVLVAAPPASAEPTRRVVLRVCYGDDPTPTQLQVLDRAQKQATAIYEAIGVSLVWTDESDTHVKADDMRLTVRIVSDARADRFMQDSPHSDAVLGIALYPTTRIYIFWDRILRHAVNREAVLYVVLGRVLAHEIGHQLLPAQGHSATGLMRRSPNYKSMHPPAFTDAEVESIRTFLVAAN